MKKLLIVSLLAVAVVLAGCSEPQAKTKTKAVYMLLDTSGTYTKELDKAQKIINYLLLTLNSGDSIAVARIDRPGITPSNSSPGTRRRLLACRPIER